MQEFYAQGDQEREMGLAVTPFLDRTKPIPEEKFQSGFIKAIVRPLYLAFAKTDGVTIDVCTRQLETNLEYFTEQIVAKDKVKVGGG